MLPIAIKLADPMNAARTCGKAREGVHEVEHLSAQRAGAIGLQGREIYERLSTRIARIDAALKKWRRSAMKG